MSNKGEKSLENVHLSPIKYTLEQPQIEVLGEREVPLIMSRRVH
jgi:hypothetical protein